LSFVYKLPCFNKSSVLQISIENWVFYENNPKLKGVRPRFKEPPRILGEKENIGGQ